MKRLGTVAAAAALVLGLALPALAQAPAAMLGGSGYSVTFGGQMRVYGLVWDNYTDFADTDGGQNPIEKKLGLPAGRNKDSESYFFQRWRLFTTVESADKKAKAYWALEVGDITWGNGGGASACDYGGPLQTAAGATAQNCTNGVGGPASGGSRLGNNSGGGFGADGVNVETKNLYLQFDIPFLPNANLLLGIHNVVLMTSPAGAFLDDDAAGIQFNWKMDPIDLQVWYAKLSENTRANADDNDFYAARFGVNLTKDTRFTVEGLVVNEQCFQRRFVASPTGASTIVDATGTAVTGNFSGSCVKADFGDTFWVGATAQTKIADITLHGSVVYGQRQQWNVVDNNLVEESGWGAQVVAQVPIGPIATWWHGWYTTGDEHRPVGGGCQSVTAHPQCGSTALAGTRSDFSVNANTVNLRQDSDKLPIPDTGASWSSVPYILEWMKGLASIGAPGWAQNYSDSTGTWGVGGSAVFSIIPEWSVGGGVGYMRAVETGGPAGGGVFGDSILEVDAGTVYRYNANLQLALLASYAFPDEGDDAWAVAFRAQFAF